MFGLTPETLINGCLTVANRSREASIRDRIALEMLATKSKLPVFVQKERRIPISSDGGNRRYCRAIDIYAEIDNQKYIVEVKSAKVYHAGVGQLIAYQALHCSESKLVLVLYGTPLEVRQYAAECRLVLASLKRSNGLDIKLMIEIG